MIKETAISLPFSIDSYGKVSSTTDQSKIWADRVRSIIGTSLRERVVMPNVGTKIPFTLFETQSQAEAEIIKEVQRAFSSQLPLLTLQSVDIAWQETSNVTNVTIVYDLPNNTTVDTVVGVILINSKRPPYEELL